MTGFDAAARLAEGLPAVDVVEEYVAACARLGYHHPDLTARAGQARDWYTNEDGLDLRALDADCASLAAAADAAESAAVAHTELVGELGRAWNGRGAIAAGEFAWRSGEAGTEVGSSLRRSAEALATLRDELWRAVDAKVDTVLQIDARHREQRPEWLAAARTVTSGAGDVAAASELVDLAVTPFVNDVVGSEWVAAMRSAIASIGAAYDTAIARVSAGRGVVFEVPGEFGPRPGLPAPAPTVSAGLESVTAPVAGVALAVPAAAVAPAAEVPTAAATAPSSAAGPAPQFGSASTPFGPPAPPAADSTGMSSGQPSTPDLGGGAPSSLGGGGLAGFGQQLADLIGSLFGSAEATPTEPAALDADVSDGALDDPELEDDGDPADEEDPAEEDDPEEGQDEEPTDDEATLEEGESADPKINDTAATEAEPDPAATVPPPPVEPPPAVEPPPPASPMAADAPAPPAEPTPCEIAEDELPQVGE